MSWKLRPHVCFIFLLVAPCRFALADQLPQACSQIHNIILCTYSVPIVEASVRPTSPLIEKKWESSYYMNTSARRDYLNGWMEKLATSELSCLRHILFRDIFRNSNGANRWKMVLCVTTHEFVKRLTFCSLIVLFGTLNVNCNKFVF